MKGGLMTDKLYIILFPTTRCDVGCRHCLNSVTMNGLDLPFEYAQLLIEKLQAEKLEATFCATGFGEPLLYPEFNRLADLILNQYGSEELSLLTAGYTDREYDKRDKLMQLIGQESENFALVLSYNLYANFDQRLKAFLSDVNNLSESLFFNVKFCVSRENGQDTIINFATLLMNFAKDNSLPEVGLCGIDEKYNWKNGPDFLASRKYLLHGRHADHKIRTMAHTLSLIGRASGFKETAWYRQKCDCLDACAESALLLFPDGYIYPCARSIDVPQRRLGHITTHSISEMLRKKKRLVQCARKLFAPIEFVFDKTPCAICRPLPI
jgi:radical SAM protein with 4Fe4S-binding SPASM domain